MNGGGYLTLNYQKTGYLSAQRQANVPWQDFVVLDDVVLIARDAQATTVDLTQPTVRVAQGSTVTDQDGTRQATLLIPPGTTAEVYNPDGSTRSITSLTLRATEYTVGPNGPETMPAHLPPNVGYTYALELSADEATIKKDGKDVLFNQPVPFYVENFLNFPVGIDVPVGYYDNTKGAWIPADSGRIIKVLSISDGKADLDVSGSGTTADASALAALGITDDERAKLASLYPAGKSLWRVRLAHLSTWDCNWPFGPPPDAKPGPSPSPPPPPPPGCSTCPCPNGENTASGSVIGCESQTLGERIPVVGADLALNYRSDRTPDRLDARTLTIPLSGASIPASLKRIEAQVTVAGRIYEIGPFPSQANQTTTFTWDGQNAYGLTQQGAQPAIVKIGYVYDGVYQRTTRFGYNGNGTPITGSRTRQEVTLWGGGFTTTLGALGLKQVGIAGWSLDAHHTYDPVTETLYLGDGTRRSGQSWQQGIILSFAGVVHACHNYDSGSCFSGDGGPATQARLHSVGGIAVTADGSTLIADQGNSRVRRVDPNGIITTFAGTGGYGFSGDGGPATQAQLEPLDVAVAPDGSVFIADIRNKRIRKIDRSGVISTYAGDGSPYTLQPYSVAAAPDGNLYVGESGGHVKKIDPLGN